MSEPALKEGSAMTALVSTTDLGRVIRDLVDAVNGLKQDLASVSDRIDDGKAEDSDDFDALVEAWMDGNLADRINAWAEDELDDRVGRILQGATLSIDV